MKVSVIIPTLNRPGYLAQTVHSVLLQTHPVFEIIIVDDGSLDVNRRRNDTLKKWDERIKIFNFPENKGVSAARNYGLEKSAGDFILFLDDDDLLKPQMVESNLRIFVEDKKADVVSSGYGMFFDTNPPDADWKKEKQQRFFPEKILLSLDYGDTSMLSEQPFSALLRKSLQVSTCLVRRRAIGKARFQEELTRGEDIFFWLILANAGCGFRINHSQFGYYRLHKYNSLSTPDWRRATLNFRNKLLREKMVHDLNDRILVHTHIARMLLKYDKVQCLKQLFIVCRILLSIRMISSLPRLLKAVPVKFYSSWKNRCIRRVRKTIIAGQTHGNGR